MELAGDLDALEYRRIRRAPDLERRVLDLERRVLDLDLERRSLDVILLQISCLVPVALRPIVLACFRIVFIERFLPVDVRVHECRALLLGIFILHQE